MVINRDQWHQIKHWIQGVLSSLVDDPEPSHDHDLWLAQRQLEQREQALRMVNIREQLRRRE